MSKKKRKVTIQPKSAAVEIPAKNLQLKPTSRVVMDIDRSLDKLTLSKCDFNWATLALSVSRAKELITNYMVQVSPIINSDEYFKTIPVADQEMYKRACSEYLDVIEALSASIEIAETTRNGRVGSFESMEEYNQYQVVCTEIAGRVNEFMILTGPLMTVILSYGIPEKSETEVVH